MSVIVDGVDVGYFETAETNAEFYGYNESSTHQATNLDSSNVILNSSTRTIYFFVHRSTSTGDWAAYIHIYNSNDTNEGQAQVTWTGFGQALQSNRFVRIEDRGIDITQHGETSFVLSENNPVRNDGGGTFVQENGASITPFSAYTVVQDEVTDLSGDERGQDTYKLNDNRDPVTRNFFAFHRGDGAGYRMTPDSFSFTLELSTLDDGRDSGEPVPDEWVGVGPNGNVSKTAGVGSTLSVTIDV
jgi:hypothetical protein